MNVKRVFVAVGLVAALAGCGSSVKLNDTPVEDRNAAGTAPGGGGAGSGGAQTGVAPVTADPAVNLQPGPRDAGRVVYFDYDSYVIKPEFQSLIEAHARYLRANNGRRVAVEGHTDERGGREYNLALGQRRSEAVRRALTLLGVPDSQIEAVSFGKEKPAESGSDESAFSKNRRAEIAYR
ncbi:peptidoglycan-associated lipoprotein Pal [Ramlibacter tataouinensis]|uniref:Peptidoglycan-associated lipoprotein n=1 Tax=Ramlibacter tataouinensis (strain ATCC BAA-407 / DSM 14655 / LMG 21543 / TTB310) TaxID=365046 RepID=F5XYM4_RAMTT|nr:peptidoglycan-associated lipoprotein Pal [Ramlibacter tataouinensis]AEG93200.1 Candidate peptidoglycan-associated lipoprotein precursor [Ramlibacter tataouinensis TTB310]